MSSVQNEAQGSGRPRGRKSTDPVPALPLACLGFRPFCSVLSTSWPSGCSLGTAFDSEGWHRANKCP